MDEIGDRKTIFLNDVLILLPALVTSFTTSIDAQPDNIKAINVDNMNIALITK